MTAGSYWQHEQAGDRHFAEGAYDEAHAAYARALELRPDAKWIVRKLAKLKPAAADQANLSRLNLFLHWYTAQDPERAEELRQCLDRNIDSGLFSRIILLVDDDTVPHRRFPGLQIIHLTQRPSYLDWISAAARLCPGQIAILANSDIHFDSSIARLCVLFGRDPGAFVALSRFDQQGEALVPHPNPHWSQDAWAFIPAAETPARLARRTDIPLSVPRCDNHIAYVFANEGHTVYNPFPFIRAVYPNATLSRHRAGTDQVTNDSRLVGGMMLVHPGSDLLEPAWLEAAVITADDRELLASSATTSIDSARTPRGIVTRTSKFLIVDRMARLNAEMAKKWCPGEAPPPAPGPVISYCIPLMGRLKDIQGTLASNLAEHKGLEGIVEFLIVLFGESAESLAWIEAEHGPALESGVLRVVTDTETLDSWHFGKAKNAFRPHLHGQIYSSLDADNFVTLDETRRLLDIQNQFEGYFLFHHFSGQWGDGTSGRISMPAAIYRRIGYDPSLLHRQYDEIDIMLRVLQHFPDLPFLCLDRQRSFLSLSKAAKSFAEAEGFTNPIAELPGYKRHVPLNPRGTNYVTQAPELLFMGEFNAALSGYRAASSAEKREEYLSQVHYERRRLLDAMPADILLESFFRRAGRPEVAPLGAEDIALFACVRDEGHFLPEFLRHYRACGVTAFFIVDDGSAEPVEQAFPDPDVHVFHPKVADFRTAKTLWMEALMKAHLSEGNWALTVDADEFIDLPPGTDSFATLARQLEAQGRDFATGLMLDLLPDPATPPERLARAETEFRGLFTHCGDFPGEPGADYANHHSIKWGFGPHAGIAWQVDIRYHAFGTFDSLRKIPFLRWRSGRHLNQGFHTLHHADKAQDPGREIWTLEPILPVRHYKLVRLFSHTERDRMLQTAGQYFERTAGNITRIFSGAPGTELLARIAENLVPVAGQEHLTHYGTNKIEGIAQNEAKETSGGTI